MDAKLCSVNRDRKMTLFQHWFGFWFGFISTTDTFTKYIKIYILFNKNVCNILNVTVITMLWWNKAQAQQK